MQRTNFFSARAAVEKKSATANRPTKSALELSPSEAKWLAAKSEILCALNLHRERLKQSPSAALRDFELKYAADDPELEISDATRLLYPTIDADTIRSRWEPAFAEGGEMALVPHYRGRAPFIIPGSALEQYIGGWHGKRPHGRIAALYRELRKEFPEAALPVEETVGRFLKRWDQKRPAEAEYSRNPDAWRSHKQLAIGNATASISYFNQCLEIDCGRLDFRGPSGRRLWIVALIDRWSRVAMFFVCENPSADATLALIRRWILKYGYPEEILGDNGAEFLAGRVQFVLRLARIKFVAAAPYSPFQKPHVERVIKTVNHQLGEAHPDSTGHNVAGGQEIRAQQSFEQRRGQTRKAGDVSADEIAATQTLVVAFTEIYNRRPHSGIAGKHPEQRRLESPGQIRKPESQRELDLFLMPAPSGDGTRKITKKGIHCEGCDYFAVRLAGFVGHRVRVFFDPSDMGKLSCYAGEFGLTIKSESDEIIEQIEPYGFISEAVNLDRLGVAERREMALVATQAQKRLMRESLKSLRRLKNRIRPEAAMEALLSLDSSKVAETNNATARETVRVAKDQFAAELTATVNADRPGSRGGPSLEFLETIAAGAELLERKQA